MIARKSFLSVISLLTALGLSHQAWSEELSNKYLHGKWMIDGTDCSDASSEFVVFQDSGAVESLRAGKLEAAGFWELDEEVVVFHVVASPAFFHGVREKWEALKAFEGQFHAFRVRVVPFDVKADQFGSVGILGEQVITGSFQRC